MSRSSLKSSSHSPEAAMDSLEESPSPPMGQRRGGAQQGAQHQSPVSGESTGSEDLEDSLSPAAAQQHPSRPSFQEPRQTHLSRIPRKMSTQEADEKLEMKRAKTREYNRRYREKQRQNILEAARILQAHSGRALEGHMDVEYDAASEKHQGAQQYVPRPSVPSAGAGADVQRKRGRPVTVHIPHPHAHPQGQTVQHQTRPVALHRARPRSVIPPPDAAHAQHQGYDEWQ